MSTAIVSRNPLVSHCAVPTVTPRSAMSAGSATLMIVSLRIMTNAEPTSSQITSEAPSGGGGSVVGASPGVGSVLSVAGPVIDTSPWSSRRMDATERSPGRASEFAAG
jgi:hypothetical protein